MKKFLRLFFITLVISLFVGTTSMAADKVVKSVAVTDIEAPYSENRNIDTDGKVPNGAFYRITNIAWKLPNESLSNFYEVTVTLEASVGYIFSGDTTGTINGENIIGKRLIKDNKQISITYAFDENSSTSSLINNATSNVRYRINVYFNKEKGNISPYSSVRVLEGKSQTFIITPNKGYKIKDVKIDGDSMGAISEYTFKKVKESHTIRAYFEETEEEIDIDLNDDKDANREMKPLLKLLLEYFTSII